MKKTLIYHLYLNNDIDSNIIYKIHYKCLKHYAVIFDKMKFIISIDDLNDKNLIEKGIKWVLDISNGIPIIIKIVKNDEYREARTFYDEIYNNNEDRGLVYWGHSKGLSNIYNNMFNCESIKKWVCTMYFYNLELVKDVENLFFKF